MTEKHVILEPDGWYTITYLPLGARTKTRTVQMKYAGWNSTFDRHDFFYGEGISSLLDEQIKLISKGV